MTGGLTPPGLVTENVSVRHWPLEKTDKVPEVARTPFFRIPTEEVDEVEGPVTENTVKSRRSYITLQLMLC